jgi:hypothetical protein
MRLLFLICSIRWGHVRVEHCIGFVLLFDYETCAIFPAVGSFPLTAQQAFVDMLSYVTEVFSVCLAGIEHMNVACGVIYNVKLLCSPERD